MPDKATSAALTDSLEDYLETVYELVREKKFARVKEIAQARNVRPGSVSPAMRRLADLGLIEYARREYIVLTPEGEERARRVVARHRLLCRLFEDLLKMPRATAEEEACSMEHSLSDEGMDRLVRFFEFLTLCPDAQEILARFHECPVVTGSPTDCDQSCNLSGESGRGARTGGQPLGELAPGDRGRVTQVANHGEVRQRLLDMGIMPDVEIDVDRIDSRDGLWWIRLQGFEISLTAAEAASVIVNPIP